MRSDSWWPNGTVRISSNHHRRLVLAPNLAQHAADLAQGGVGAYGGRGWGAAGCWRGWRVPRRRRAERSAPPARRRLSRSARSSLQPGDLRAIGLRVGAEDAHGPLFARRLVLVHADDHLLARFDRLLLFPGAVGDLLLHPAALDGLDRPAHLLHLCRSAPCASASSRSVRLST